MTDSNLAWNLPENTAGTPTADAFGAPPASPDGMAFTGNPAPAASAEQLAYQRGQQDMLKKITAPRMTAWRIACGICETSGFAPCCWPRRRLQSGRHIGRESHLC